MFEQNRQKLLQILQKDPLLQAMKTSTFESGSTVVKEGDFNQRLYVVLEGEISLHKSSSDGNEVHIDQLRPGDLLGLVSFVSDGPALTTARALTDVSAIRINKEEFQELIEGKNELSPVFHQLIIGNLLNRYQHTVGLQLKFELLTRQLDLERKQLKSALEHLEAIQNQLISQEKMALLGELSAGISHEMNNPASSLSRSVEHLSDQLSHIVDHVRDLRSEHIHTLMNLGRSDRPSSTVIQREQTLLLQKKYPKINRTIIRKLAGCSDESRTFIFNNIAEKNIPVAIEIYETGHILRIMKDSTKRISALVQSLRSFSKPSTGYQERIDIREGLENTIQLLQHKLKIYQLHLDLDDVLPVAGNSGELNQVWTNILDNACDALKKQTDGAIWVKTYNHDNRVIVDIWDNGPGVSDEIKKRIFDANFTTKNTDGSFGLGIGLTITRDIVSKHKGEIKVKDSEHDGAWFQIILPGITTRQS